MAVGVGCFFIVPNEMATAATLSRLFVWLVIGVLMKLRARCGCCIVCKDEERMMCSS